MRNSTALTHCALTCCVMWGIIFGFILSSTLVLLNQDDTYITPEMYGGGAHGFHRAVNESVRQQKILKASRRYDDVVSWNVPSNLFAVVNEIPRAHVNVLNVKNISLAIKYSNSFNVSNVSNAKFDVSTRYK